MIKTLPLSGLNIVAVQIVVDETDTGVPIFDLDVMDDAAYARFTTKGGVNTGDRCDCCGHSLKYACVVEHTPTSDFYFVGRDCARAIETFRSLHGRIEDLCLHLARKSECDRRERDFAKNHPDAVEALAWARTGINRTAADIASKLRSYGLSDNQRTFLQKLHSDDVARRAAATGVAPTGKARVSGVVLSAKVVTKPGFGYRAPDVHVAQVLVDLGNGAKVWGNAPKEFINHLTFPHSCSIDKGDRVSFNATFTPSDKDPLFGFWKRPTKWVKE